MKIRSICQSLLALTLLFCFAGQKAQAQGSVRAVYFPGTGVLTPTPVATTNSYVDLGTALKDSLATTNFTIELWVKMGSTNSVNPVIIGDKDWASGSNTGFVLSYYASTDASSGTAAANTLRFNFKPASGTRVDYDIVFPASIAQRWNHIAVTVNRTGSIIGYLNGVATGHAYVVGAENISADSAKTLAGTLPVRLGTDGKPFGYRAPFNGTMDEVRIWKSVRTPQQLRDNMCHKLTGTEANLLAYYKMDEATGTTISNNATATTGSFNGTFVNATSHIGSGAPVGDTSVNLYTSTWAGQSLQLATANKGIFTIDSISNAGSYLHLYQINAVPDSTSGLTPYSNNNVYFGTFASGDTFTYYPKYNYGNFTNAVTYSNSIGFFTRQFNADALWSSKTNLYNNGTTTQMRLDSIKGSRQFFLANFISTCNVPSALGAINIQATTAQLTWTSGGSALWNIQYGTTGFVLGSGTMVAAVNTNPYALGGLQGNTTYQYYVQDTCTGIGASTWAGPYTFTTLPDYSNAGSGYALHFNGTGVQNSTVQAVNLGSVLRDSLAKTDFTIEMWVKVGATNTGNPPLIADKDYVSGANTGICWTYTASVLWGDAAKHVFRFNFKPNGGTRRDYDMIAANEFTWNHLAITVDRKGFIKGYINGVYKPSTYASGAGSVAADSSKTLAGTMPLYLGTDGTGNYRVPFNGDMDEVRIFKRVLSETEIRESMCHKLQGNDSGLVAYYRMDQPAGPTVINNAIATAGLMNGTDIDNIAHVISAAPVGDTSVTVYPVNGWNGVSLSLNSSDRGMVTVDSIVDAAVPGIHIYAINGTPNFANGISDIGSTNKYFGVFTSDNASATYHVKYDYSNYTNATTSNANLHLYNRPNNAINIWTQLPAVQNITNNTIEKNAALGVRQYLLADFSPAGCLPPSNISLNGFDTTSATVTWTSTASTHATKYGPAGFNLQDSTAATITVNTQTLSGLQPATSYDFYVQDSCSNGNGSAWVGPYSFTTVDACPAPVNIHADSITPSSLVLKWTDNGSVTTGYQIAWGISQTFTDPTIAITQNTTEPRYAFTGLQPVTAYDFYVKTNCNASTPNSGWEGPYTFTTDSVHTPPPPPTSISQVSGADSKLRIYPNPTDGKVNIELLDNNAAGVYKLTLYNNLGMVIFDKSVTKEVKVELKTQELSDGIYHIEFNTRNGRMHKAIVVRHK
ncbi:T9SS type A sorting domain-containing protein [Taibaiella lutea]|uniref:T9SS type A sorting domain-containing protein n=1 Tax=Taibaiella lutea TaxID=2608001 RepID=A0A5M6CJI8_9BACT|nr:LamG-like jellyroll fold domain-containing protein [Taibaiella lutea]KAA5534610.1 T9SS type A sorting domain-containing protein [Taibaiella lutea]